LVSASKRDRRSVLPVFVGPLMMELIFGRDIECMVMKQAKKSGTSMLLCWKSSLNQETLDETTLEGAKLSRRSWK
jgi:hypothetical protein